MQTIFSLHNLEADNFFQPTTAYEQFFYEKGHPPIKNNGPSLKFSKATIRFLLVDSTVVWTKESQFLKALAHPTSTLVLLDPGGLPY